MTLAIHLPSQRRAQSGLPTSVCSIAVTFGVRQPRSLPVLPIRLSQPAGELAIEVSRIAEPEMVHVQLAQLLDLAKARTDDNPRQDEVDVDRVAADAVGAGEAYGRHESDAGLRRCDIVRTALADQRHEAREEIAAGVGRAREEFLDRVIAAGVRQVLGQQFRAAPRA